MNDTPVLATPYTFKEKEYLIKMRSDSSTLELVVGDKLMGEEWQNTYDASYIENLTQRTGNYKEFHVFVAMLKTGLLKTGESITLDLLTVDDLELLRCHNASSLSKVSSRTTFGSSASTRRYLILTYSVEFDRIHYPLPLEYGGPPDPTTLQSIIRRLQCENEKLKEQLLVQTMPGGSPLQEKLRTLEARAEELSHENVELINQIEHLERNLPKQSKSCKQNEVLQNSMKRLEKQVMQERTDFKKIICKLKEEKQDLLKQVEELRTSEQHLRIRLKNLANKPKFTTQLDPARRLAPDGLSPVQRKESVKTCGTHKLTCRPVSSWSNTFNLKRNISSNRNSSTDSSNERGCLRAKTTSFSHNTNFQKTLGDTVNTRLVSRRHSREHAYELKNILPSHTPPRNRHSSNISSESTVRVKRRGRKYSQDISSSRQSSLQSRHSSQNSKASTNSNISRGTKTGNVNNHLSRRDQFLQQNEDLQFSMTDLEVRIQALQKLLQEGLSLN